MDGVGRRCSMLKRRWIALIGVLVWGICSVEPGFSAQPEERVRAIAAPATPLPSEEQSQGITRFSFIVYGDTRGRHDGVAIQYDHSQVVDAMLAQIKRLRDTPDAVRFVLQSGDAVVDGGDA